MHYFLIPSPYPLPGGEGTENPFCVSPEQNRRATSNEEITTGGSHDGCLRCFYSYAHADADWVRVLAENLHQQGLQVFFDKWEIGPGDVLVHRLDKGILNSRNGIFVVSPDSLSRPWVAEEYTAMITRAVAAK
jgi:hypothetical protein